MNTVRLFRAINGKGYQGEERRKKPRIYYPIPIQVRGKKSGSARLQFDTIAEDLSAGGFSACTEQEFQQGQRLFLKIRFSLAQNRSLQSATVVANGIVLRTKNRYDGSNRFAVQIVRFRFI
jgi:hypothetical protein